MLRVDWNLLLTIINLLLLFVLMRIFLFKPVQKIIAARQAEAEKEIADMVVDATVKIVGEKKGADVDNALYDKFLDKAGDET